MCKMEMMRILIVIPDYSSHYSVSYTAFTFYVIIKVSSEHIMGARVCLLSFLVICMKVKPAKSDTLIGKFF